MDQVFTLKKKFKNTGKMEKILEKSGNFVSPEKWEPWRNGQPFACILAQCKVKNIVSGAY